jgi:hypothetical protein
MPPNLLPWLLLLSSIFRPSTGEIVPFEAVTPASSVDDPIFAYLVGLVDGDLYGSVDAEALEEAVGRSGKDSRLPYQSLERLTRIKGPGRFDNRIHAIFREPLRLPVPYRILGYSPGTLTGSQTISFREYPLGNFSFHHGKGKERKRSTMTEVRLFGVLDGQLVIDIDGWVDRLAGGKLDDTRVTGLVLFWHGGDRWGMAVGYNRDWKGRSGVLNLRENKIRFPSPPGMKTAARKLRQILESYEPSLRPDSLSTKGVW